MIEERTIATRTHGRYLVRPARDRASAPILVGFHGYGENADRHLEALARLDPDHRYLLCAIEALHPFYSRRTGEVVGSWMTRRNRELAIADNVAYVAAVVRDLLEAGGGPDLGFVGFSQGVAMAWRAAAGCGVRSRALVVLAGDIPPELRDLALSGFPPVLLGRGTDEAWYSREKLARDRTLADELGLDLVVSEFVGGHEWAEPFTDHARLFLAQHLDRSAPA